MRYAEKLLTQGERVVMRSRQHWFALILESRRAILLWLIGFLVLGVIVATRATETAFTILSAVMFVAFVLGLLIFLVNLWQWWAQDYLVTNRRILKVEGVLNKRAGDSALEKINDALLTQHVLGRMFDYGDLDILTASESSIDRLGMLNHAPEFKRTMLQQKYALETEFAYREPPSPPLRADRDDRRYDDDRRAEADRRYDDDRRYDEDRRAEADRRYESERGDREQREDAARYGDLSPRPVEPALASAGSAASAPSTPGTEPTSTAAPAATSIAAGTDAEAGGRSSGPADAAEITATLARLADLRDRGAISAEDYEIKKRDLLSRL